MHLLTELGFFTDSTFPVMGISFWSTPIGLFMTAIMCISTFILIHKRDGVFNTLYYSALSLVFFIAFMVGLDERNPHNIVKMLLTIFTLRFFLLAIKELRGKK